MAMSNRGTEIVLEGYHNKLKSKLFGLLCEFEKGREQELFNRELLNFAQKIMDKISNDIDNNQQTPQAEMYSLMNILKNLPQVKQQITEPKQSQKQKTLSPEHFKQIEKELLGIEN